MKTRKIEIFNKQKNKIVGSLNFNKNKKLIIICSGYDTTKEFTSIKKLAKELANKEYDVLRFDFSGSGESEGPKNVLLKQQVDDLNSVVNYFKDYQKIILLGGSLGALSSSIVSILNPNVTNLVTINGFFGDFELGKRFRKNYYLYRIASFIIPKYRKDYRFFKNSFRPEKIKIPVLVIYTKNDDIVNPIQSERIYSRLSLSKKRKLVSLQLIRHELTGKDDVKKVTSVINI